MIQSKRLNKIILAMVDLILLYLSLAFALTIRYGSFPSKKLWVIHWLPFLIIYFIWIIIFYIAGLYEIENFISAGSLRNRVFKTMVMAGVLTTILFYLIPYFKIAPKTNLAINVILATILIWLWRKILFVSAIKSSKIKIFFLGPDREISDFAGFIDSRPQLGYKTADKISEAHVIIVSEQAKQNPEDVQSLYEFIRSGKTVMDFDKFYESITGKIPVSLISKTWFLENLLEINKQAFEKFKRVIDVALALILSVPIMIIFPFIALLIKMEGGGPVLFKQKRVGKNGKIFEIKKFRSMIINAEKNGAQWAQKNDKRITKVGNLLRKTRIDELPQIWNVLRGDLSFVGPRPERPEFVQELENKIPHYSMRHLVKPGLSGWAQINFPYGASIEDATEKLQYDLYYIKNRSLALEFSILLKTIMIILRREGR